MKTMTCKINPDPLLLKRNRERGAALLTMLMVAILLLSAGLALVTSTSLSTTNTIDATAEMQAYSGAEAGLQATLNVLRGNVAPDASLGTIKMNFRNAANPATSNKTTDTWTGGARLSGWLNYSYQSATTANDWRVPLCLAPIATAATACDPAYAPSTGIAFKILITDPDDPGPIATRKITTDVNYRPTQLIIQSVGYGPKGAIKRLEMIVKFSAFDFDPPAAITLPGGPGININLGDSSNVTYSGIDLSVPPKPTLPAIAVAPGNVVASQTVIDGLHNDDQVQPNNATALTDDTTPSFVRSADEARLFLDEMRELADSSGRLFATQAAANAAGGLGTTAAPKLTFIDNYGGTAVDLGANHQGSGLLIVTGELLTHGNTDFEGIILVLGRGRLNRDGGGNGVLKGAILVANFDPDDPDDEVIGPPDFDIDGGGDSKIRFDSLWVRKALDVSGFRVLGVREYHDDGYLGTE